MADDTGPIAAVLHALIQACQDGKDGFGSAARLVGDTNLHRLFESYAQQRSEFAAEWELEVHRMGGNPLKRGDGTPALQRSWFDMQAEASGTDDGTVISACERGEAQAVRRFQEAIEEGLPPALRAIAERQLLELHETHKHLLSLERAHRRMA